MCVTSNCQWSCNKSPFGFVCTCPPGKKLARDNRTCEGTVSGDKLFLPVFSRIMRSCQPVTVVLKVTDTVRSTSRERAKRFVSSCTDLHPCERWGVCSQVCEPLTTGWPHWLQTDRYQCKCLDQYSLARDNQTCVYNGELHSLCSPTSLTASLETTGQRRACFGILDMLLVFDFQLLCARPYHRKTRLGDQRCLVLLCCFQEQTHCRSSSRTDTRFGG